MAEITSWCQPQTNEQVTAQPNDFMATLLAAFTSLKQELRSDLKTFHTSVKQELKSNIENFHTSLKQELRSDIQNLNKKSDLLIEKLEETITKPNQEVQKCINKNDTVEKNELKTKLSYQTALFNETKSKDVTIIQSSPIQDGELLGSINDESTKETKDGEDPTNVQSIENIVVDNNQNLDESYINEEIKETTDDEKDCENTVICEESMAEIFNDSEASKAEKEENIDEEKEILIEKEDESRCDDINPDLPVIEETDLDNISEDEKGETLTDITTNDRPSKPKNKVIDIRDPEEIKADKGPYRIKQKIVVIDPG
ncbi:unnamed protein product [Nezara viridula]|uniref:Uncharacterized protein n=1 Tax=Nezara viridula TaxID=85310 RepID=A0A9P0H4H2_NEZVI|nr:unnamed protein product [Nezara viridula]